jgi:NADPH:quinone reductase-like Zn-dependent oxidoreductase
VSKIRKVVIAAFGDESRLAVCEAELPDPIAGEVQLIVEYSIVSGSDVNMRRGTYPLQKKAPLTPGYSVLGTVAVSGEGCSRFKIGDRVACLSKYEGQAERINLPERFLVPVPDGVDRKAAVALVLDWVTAHQMLHRSARVAWIGAVRGLGGVDAVFDPLGYESFDQSYSV